MAVVDELRTQYGDRVDFQVIEPEETKAARAALDVYNLTSRGHGLVAFSAQGEAVVTIAGHNYGREAVMLALGQVIEL